MAPGGKFFMSPDINRVPDLYGASASAHSMSISSTERSSRKSGAGPVYHNRVSFPCRRLRRRRGLDAGPVHS